MSNKVSIVVDMQNDFIDGSLGTPEAIAIVSNVVNKIGTIYVEQPDGSRCGKTMQISTQTSINLAPRIRIATLYAVSQSNNGRVANTCNLSEGLYWIFNKMG